MKSLPTALLLLLAVNAYSQSDYWIENEDSTLTDLWIDSVHSFNVHVNNKTRVISFAALRNQKMTTIGKFKTTIPNIDAVRLEDLNGDGIDEIIAATGRNMNGNQWLDVFMFVPEKNTFAYSGPLNTDYKVDSVNHTINVTYTGSWYMTIYKKQYIWRDTKLLPEKMLSISLKYESTDCDSVYVDQYKSVPAGSGNLLSLIHI